MLTEERYAAILKLLEEKKAVSVLELTELLNSSESTIRRDLTALHQMGKLTKVHGGATSINGVYQMTEDKTSVRHNLHVEEKNRIAQCAASLVHKNDFVFLDAGTTTERMIDYLHEQDAVYVTNGIVHARKLAEKGLKAYILSGKINGSRAQPSAVSFFHRLFRDKRHARRRWIQYAGHRRGPRENRSHPALQQALCAGGPLQIQSIVFGHLRGSIPSRCYHNCFTG